MYILHFDFIKIISMSDPTTTKHHETAPEDKVPMGQKLAVASGGVAHHNGGMVVQYLAQPIFQISLGLTPWLFGLAMMLPRVWDAFTDPIMGRISDRYRSKYGRRRPFIALGSILMAVTFTMIWMVPRDSSDLFMFGWLVVTSILFATSYTIFSIPMGALTYELTPDYHERSRVMMYWAFATSFLSNTIINWYAPLTNSDTFDDPLMGARIISIGVSLVIFIGLGFLPAIFAKERFYEVAQKSENQVTFMQAVKQTVACPPLLALVGLQLGLSFSGVFGSALAQYICIYHVMGGDEAKGIAMNAMNGTGFGLIGFFGVPVLTYISTKFSKRLTLQVVLWMSLIGGLAKWFIFTPDMPYLLLLDSVLNGPIWVILYNVIPSMNADICDYDEELHGERREGMISSVSSWIIKVGGSFTFLVSGIALSMSGFDSELGMNQPEGTITSLRIFFVGSSVFAALWGLFCLNFYKITEESAYVTRQVLEKRRGKA
jgi:GPH family glycoside/pentoside/hexuronide:cation symporter